jgi:Tfp pilus assembly protein PilF
MNKTFLYLNSLVFALLVVFTVFMNAQAADKDYKYGSSAKIETSVHYLKQSVDQQKEIVQLLKAIKNDSQQKEVIGLLVDIKGLLIKSNAKKL